MINKGKKGFTLIEIIIAAGVLALFMTGLFSLYRGGSKLSNATIWAQRTINKLKLACRQINDSIKKSTYPTALTFPGQIIENDSDEFGLHYYEGTMCATETAGITGTDILGAKFLALTESTPAKTGYSTSENKEANIIYHIFSLNDAGILHYTRWEESVPGDQIATLNRAAIPPGSANRIFSAKLARDVELITVQPNDATDPRSSISILVRCKIPNGNTTRSEKAVGTPNVDLVAHNSVGGW
ncbi:MAG: type IV pilus modification PilV family protein [Candidatus Rifleibacteriota bacterium]